MSEIESHPPQDGGRIRPGEVADALTRASFTYPDGSTQEFTRDGRTTYVEGGRVTTGDWGVDERGTFWSFWPPSYRAEYDVFWVTEADTAVGVRFVELRRGSVSEGRYAVHSAPAPE